MIGLIGRLFTFPSQVRASTVEQLWLDVREVSHAGMSLFVAVRLFR
jgi:hypothetical protein